MDNFHLFQIPTDLELFNWNDKSPEVSRGGVAGTAGDMANLTKESQQAPSHSAKPAKETQQNTR